MGVYVKVLCLCFVKILAPKDYIETLDFRILMKTANPSCSPKTVYMIFLLVQMP